MKKIFAILTAIAAVSMLVLTVSAADAATLTGKNEITVYAPKDGDIGGKIEISVSGGAAFDSIAGTAGLAQANDDKTKVAIVAVGVKAGDAVAKLTFTGSGSVTLTGAEDDFSGVLGTFAVGADDITTAATITDAPAASTAGSGGGSDTDNTKTGVVIAIIPAAIAAAAAAVSKKK